MPDFSRPSPAPPHHAPVGSVAPGTPQGAPIELTKVNDLIPSVVYGPIASRRLGNSLGVNLLPPDLKICSFNCPYCECGWTNLTKTRRTMAELPWPPPAQVEAEVGEGLRRCVEQSFPIHHITMAGNGEPTMHPAFDVCVEGLRRVRDIHFPEAKVAVLSNAMHIGDPHVRRGLDLLDERIMKLDGGTDETIRQVDMPVFPYHVEEIVAGIASLRDCVVQTMFVDGRFTNTGPAEVEAWMAHIGRIRPKYVQIYTIERKTPDPTMRKVPRATLDAIAVQMTAATGVEARVF